MLPQGRKKWENLLGLLGLGWYIAFCILLGVFGGLWLDSKFNSKPVLTLVGLVLGIIMAFFGTYRMVRNSIDNKNGEGKN